MPTQDPFLEFIGSSVLEADSHHAVAEQRPAAELDNHAGVRHAGALFNVGYAASRALVAAAVAPNSPSAETRMVDSEIVYEKVVGDERVIATAEPAAGYWESLLGRLGSGEAVLLPTSVTLRSDDGRTFTTMSISWNVTPSKVSRHG